MEGGLLGCSSWTNVHRGSSVIPLIEHVDVGIPYVVVEVVIVELNLSSSANVSYQAIDAVRRRCHRQRGKSDSTDDRHGDQTTHNLRAYTRITHERKPT